MTLSDIRDYLKTLDAADYYHIGRLNNKNERSLGVYNRPRAGPPVTAFGGASSYDVKAVTVLLHWNKNARESEEAALSLWEKLRNVADVDAGDGHIQYLRLVVPEPVGVGTDENGIYEYVIQFDVYYRR